MYNSKGRTVYLNGEFLPEEQATVSIFDRAYLMSDAVYEFTATIGGKLVSFDAHMQRLQRSLNELDMDFNVEREPLLRMHRELVQRNCIDVGGVYMQVSRGVADRDFAFPIGLTPTIMAFTQNIDFMNNTINDTGIKVISVEDGRWARRDIKTVQLLYTSMAKTQATMQGVHDALFVHDGFVTEATSANAFIVIGNRLITRSLSNDLLHGITRGVIMSVAEAESLTVEERPFTIVEAQNADEVFLTASPIYALSVVEIDGEKIADGLPGLLTRKLRTAYITKAQATAI